MDPYDPFRGLARKMLSDPAVGPIEHWLKEDFKVIKEYKIDGVISFCHWGCRHLSGAVPLLDEALKKEEIPILNLDGDCVDIKHHSDAQTKTRIDAFMEILEHRRKERLKI